MVDHKRTNASNTTETRNLEVLAEKTGNIYETVLLFQEQSINREVKEELLANLRSLLHQTNLLTRFLKMANR